MRRLTAVLASLLLGAATPLAAQPAPGTPAPDHQAVQAWFSGATVTYRSIGEHGPFLYTLALNPDGTGWMHSSPLPGNTSAPETRYVYRWWIAQDGRLCLLYSQLPQTLDQHSFWRCNPLVLENDGSILLFSYRMNAPAPLDGRQAGNQLAREAEAFLAEAYRHFGPQLPAPADPVRPPPP
jgi:hypothetical protein